MSLLNDRQIIHRWSIRNKFIHIVKFILTLINKDSYMRVLMIPRIKKRNHEI